MTLPHYKWSAASLAAAIRENRITSQEVVQAHLDRISSVNKTVNAVTVTLEEQALRQAQDADRQVAQGAPIGPFHGVPVTLKENFDVVGTATTHGVVGLRDAFPKDDAPVVGFLKQAGAIPIGRTNLPDYGARWHTDNDLWGATLNPWDPDRTPGGSSGGEAAAIATGMSPLGIGNDMGGSLRHPAHCCGIAALKPSLGRISQTATAMFTGPPLFYSQMAAVNGPMARHVGDLRLALRVMSQSDPGDPLWTPALDPSVDVGHPIRVALTTDPAGHGVNRDVEQGVRKAADVLADAGYEIEEIDPPSVEESGLVLERIANTEFVSYLPAMLEGMSGASGTILKRIIDDFEPDLATYMTAIGDRHRIARAWSLFMVKFPLVLGPISTMQPFHVGYDLEGPDELNRFVRSIRLTEICNLLGLPSVAVPVQMANGLPQAVQVIGPRFHEELCLSAAEAIEQHQGVITPIDPVGLASPA